MIANDFIILKMHLKELKFVAVIDYLAIRKATDYFLQDLSLEQSSRELRNLTLFNLH